ncbi:MAG: MFS transporter [Coxiellaceae bacterium]|nr:MFS transporter [Coxiellaceae bacterium]
MPPTRNAISKKAVLSWCLYDWANSAFSTIIITFIFATYFTKAIAPNVITGTAHWGYAIALSGIIIAIISPLLGAIADLKGRRKPWIAGFTLLAIIMSALLWFAKPSPNYQLFTLIVIIVANIGAEVGIVFYNSMLKDLAPTSHLGRVSGWAWGLGYIGGLLSLVVALVLFIQPDNNWFGLNSASAQQIRICGPLVAIWIFVFSLPLFFFTPDKPPTKISLIASIRQGMQQLIKTLLSLPRYKNIFIYLVARMFYIDGLNTLFAFGGIYAAGTFGLTVEDIILFGIAMNIGAGIGAIVFAWVDDYFGSKKTILFSLAFLIIFVVALLFTHRLLAFWILSLSLSVFIGPVQAASRTLMAKLAPAELVTEMFGLYAFCGKVTSFLGPWILGLVTASFASQRIGMSTIIMFFVIGALLLLYVKE